MDNFNAPGNLDIHQGNLAENWRRFKQSFDIYLTATEKVNKPDASKVAMLLNFAGEDAIELYENFTFAEEDDKKKLDKVVEQFENYCNPQRSILFERYKFWEHKQEKTETVDEYATRLRTQVKQCQFVAPQNMVRDKFVLGLYDNSVKERLLREKDSTITKALEIARTIEASRKQIDAMKNTSNACDTNSFKKEDNSEINNLQKSRRYMKEKQTQKPRANEKKICQYCGRIHAPRQCPAYGKRCNYCKKIGHFESVCRLKSRRPGQSKDVGTLRRQKDDANQRNKDKDDDPDKETPTLQDIKDINSLNSKDAWHVNVKILGKPVNFRIDTGADCNVISEKIFDELQVKNVKMHPTNVILRMFDGRKIKPKCKIYALCEHKGFTKKIDILIVKQNVTSVLGLNACIDLNLIKRVDTLQNIVNVEDKYSDVFDGLGVINNFVHKIQLNENVKPVINPPRRVPVALRDKLKAELERLENLGVIEKITEPTEWVNNLVIVKKKNDSLRICLDPLHLNRAIKREHFPMQTIEDIMTRMSDAKYFSVLDANHGFWQIRLDDDSAKLCTFNSIFGRYFFRRMPMGISSSSEVYQRVMTQIFENIDGVEIIIDDILVWGKNLEEHDQRLSQVLEKVRQSNLKLNREKCKFRLTEVSYIGHLLTSEGIKPDPKKVKAISAMPIPANVKELQCFLGMTTYLAKFLNNLSEIAAPLRLLLEKDVEWFWGPEQDSAFDKLKYAISNAPVLKYFNVNEPVILSVDASSKGVGACLIQNSRPVAYASKALTKSQQNYAQIEKEMYAIVFGCERFHDYLFGQAHITVQSDHKPLETILKKPLHCAPMRLQRMILRIQSYPLDVKYKAGKELYIADALSRAYDASEYSSEKEEELYDVNLLEYEDMADHVYKALVEETKNDSQMQSLYKTVLKGWPQKGSQVSRDVVEYWNYRDEISICENLLLKAERIIIPKKLRPNIMNRLHIAHLGIEKTKARARESVFWPNINADIEEYVSKCTTCLKHRRSNLREPLIPHDIPSTPWSTVASDIFYYRGKDYLLIVDYFSKYPEIARLQSKTSQSVISAMKEIFARHGIPEKIVADNMPFNSLNFHKFCKEWEIEIVTSSPMYPRSNGLAERFVQSIKNLLKKADESNRDIYIALLEFRNTPISDMSYSPSELLMSRKLRSKIPVSKNLLHPRIAKNVHSDLNKRQMKQKKFHDRSAKEMKELHDQDVIRIRRDGEWIPAIVVGRHTTPRSYYVETPDGSRYRRNRYHLMKTREDIPKYTGPIIDSSFDNEENEDRQMPQQRQRPQTQIRRSTRNRRPQRFIEEY